MIVLHLNGERHVALSRRSGPVRGGCGGSGEAVDLGVGRPRVGDGVALLVIMGLDLRGEGFARGDVGGRNHQRINNRDRVHEGSRRLHSLGRDHNRGHLIVQNGDVGRLSDERDDVARVSGTDRERVVAADRQRRDQGAVAATRTLGRKNHGLRVGQRGSGDRDGDLAERNGTERLDAHLG